MVHDNGVHELTAERQRHKEDCSNLAFQAASKSAVVALGAAGAGVFAANTFSPPFRRALGTSGKAALVVSPAFFYFFLRTEQVMHECAQSRVFKPDSSQY